MTRRIYLQPTFRPSSLYLLGLACMSWYAWVFIFADFSLLLGISLSNNHLLLAALSFVGGFPFIIKIFYPQSTPRSFGIVVTSLLIWGLCALVASFFQERLFDAIWYQHEGVYLLAKGWNPFYRILVEDETSYCLAYLNHFPKANWLFGAMVYGFTQKIETAKSGNLLVLCALFFVMAGGLLQRLCTLKKTSAIVLATIICLNPITLLTLNSFYVDGLVGMFLTLFIGFSALYLKGKDQASIYPALLALVILAHLKLSGTALAVLFGSALLVGVILFKKRDFVPAIKRLSIAGLLCFLVIGYHPFVTNWVQKGHPLYPANPGSDINVFNESNYPLNFVGKDRFYKFGYSLFAEAGWFRQPEQATLRPLFSMHGLSAYGAGTPDLNAMGPLFGELLVLCLLFCSVVLIRFRLESWTRIVLYFLVVSGLTLFVNREAWVFRYVPQLWLMAVCMAAVGINKKGYKWGSYLLIGGLLFNSLRMEMEVFHGDRIGTNTINASFDLLQQQQDSLDIDPGWAKSFRCRLGEHGIDTSRLILINPTDTNFSRIPGSLEGKYRPTRLRPSLKKS